DARAGISKQATIPRCHLLSSWWPAAVSGRNSPMITHHDWGRPEKIKNASFSATFVRAALDRDKPKSREYYNRAQHQRLLELFAGTIALINEHLPCDQKLATEVRDCPDADCVVEPEDVALLLELVQKRVAAHSAPQRSPAAESRFNAAVLPADFDPEAYLFHNPDVAAAGMDAAGHYLVHGWREGRRYRFF
ncbi:MAG: hypothetical protein AB7E78_14910, partial [Porticoccaceae bacterium]